jgi:hypothetical protein
MPAERRQAPVRRLARQRGASPSSNISATFVAGSKSRAAALQDRRTGPWRTARAGPALPLSPCFIWSRSGITPSRSLTGRRYRRFLNGMNANIMALLVSLPVQQ